MEKDAVCHALVKATKTFTPSLNESAMLDVRRIRSHSGRHRMINDLKACGCPSDAAIVYARIKDKKPLTDMENLTKSNVA